MQQYQNVLQDKFGNVIVGASVAVYVYGTTTPATIYSGNGTGLLPSNTVTTSSLGEFAFYAANGRYSLSITATNFALENYSDFILYDPADIGAVTASGVAFTPFSTIAATNVQNAIQEVVSDLSASSGSSLVGFLQSGTSAQATTVQAKLRETVSVKDFGAVGNGIADDTAAIQAAINAGGQIFFPVGSYVTSSTLTISKTCSLIGAAASFNDTTATSEILYSGTAEALIVGTSSAQIFNARIDTLGIRASGSATSSSTAIGLKLLNSNYAVISNLFVRGFAFGKAIVCTAANSQIGASNSFIGCFLWGNKFGYQFTGSGVGVADYASVIVSGSVIGTGVSGGVGLLVDQYAAETQVYATDFETFDVCIDLYGNGTTSGGGVKLIGSRTEFQTTMAVRINSLTERTVLLGHRFAGGASSTWLSDAGTRTLRTDTDANVRVNNTGLQFLNNIPLYMQSTNGVDRQVFKFANNDTVQIGAASFSGFNGNFALGPWHFTSPIFDSASGATGYQAPIWFGTYALWVDSSGRLRIKSSAPTSDTDGTVVGTQV